MKCRSVSRVQLAEYFVDPSSKHINEQQIIDTVTQIVAELPKSQSSKLKYYNDISTRRRELTNQLVKDEIVLRLLESKTEGLTKRAFERLKNSWVNLIQHETGQPGWKLSLNERAFRREFNNQRVYIYAEQGGEQQSGDLPDNFELSDREYVTKNDTKTPATNIIDTSGSEDTSSLNLNTKLIADNKKDNGPLNVSNPARVNINLLKDACVAYAHRQQHLNVRIRRLAIVAKKKVKMLWWMPMFLAKPLKFDLGTIYCAIGDNLGNGIRCNIEDEVIYFSGNVDETFIHKTMVVQLSKSRRILRELWFRGVANEEEKTSISETVYSVPSETEHL